MREALIVRSPGDNRAANGPAGPGRVVEHAERRPYRQGPVVDQEGMEQDAFVAEEQLVVDQPSLVIDTGSKCRGNGARRRP